MIHISQNFNQLLTQWMVKDMLNPSNKDLYIGTMSYEKAEAFFSKMPQDDDIAVVFWNAFHIAQHYYLEHQVHYTDDIVDCCPECGCQNFVEGIACPNCDFVQ